MAETLSTVSAVLFIAAGLAFAFAVFFWFWFKIPAVVGDLSGRTARKSIALLRDSNEKSNGSKSYRPQAGKKREKIARGGTPETGLLGESRRSFSEPTELFAREEATRPLTDENATALLTQKEATGPLAEENATALLMQTAAGRAGQAAGKKLTMLDEVLLVHTDEVIA